MEELLKQLHDIEGLDPVSFWPLTPFWWSLLAFVFVTLSIGAYFLRRWYLFQSSWRKPLWNSLVELEQQLSGESSWRVVKQLSEHLRRVAIYKFSRGECAGLTGEAWLKWLQERDPRGFKWQLKGKALISWPYAPAGSRPPADEIADLIKAVKRWVR